MSDLNALEILSRDRDVWKARAEKAERDLEEVTCHQKDCTGMLLSLEDEFHAAEEKLAASEAKLATAMGLLRIQYPEIAEKLEAVLGSLEAASEAPEGEGET